MLAWALLAGCMTACSLDWSFFARADADGGRTDASDAASLGDAGDPSDGGVDGATTSDAAQGNDGATTDAQDAGSGCRSNAACGPSELCHYPDHKCGQAAAGKCIPRPSPSSCPVSTPFACTCDGVVDTCGRCGSEASGIDVSTLGCSTSPGSPCGYIYCVTACLPSTLPSGETTFDCQ